MAKLGADATKSQIAKAAAKQVVKNATSPKVRKAVTRGVLGDSWKNGLKSIFTG